MSNKRRRVEQQRVVSYGVLLYKSKDDEIQYLLGLIPQRNWWTVFKGLPSTAGDETPTETALREFGEETGTQGVLETLSPVTTLHGKAGKKDLVIFLQEGSHVSEECFRLERVVTIDKGYMMGKPEIVQIQWMALAEALRGMEGAKIYTSQIKILQDAQDFLENSNSSEEQERKTRDD